VWCDTFVGGQPHAIHFPLAKALDDNSDDTRLVVTIARKAYQFTGNVTVTELADTAKQVAVQFPAAQSYSQLSLRSPQMHLIAMI
jgi:DNA-binding winged helix-turn-helix (wHTH) protein